MHPSPFDSSKYVPIMAFPSCTIPQKQGMGYYLTILPFLFRTESPRDE